MLFAYFVHYVVDGDASDQASDTVYYRQGYQVVFLDRFGHLFDAVALAYRDRLLLHHMFDLGNGRVGDQPLERENTFQAFVVVYHIYIIDLVHVFGLLTHFLDTLGHTPILVDHDHFRTHQTTGSVFVVFQQVDDIARLLHVFDVRKDLFLGVFVQFTHQVYGVVGLHIVDEAFGDQFVG